ncbi:MAG: phosphatase PAP2 family protein, partial [Clostridia bacterium]|nr:phosphatase PAP2 family protein [Clostridia bacterium]
KHPLFSKKTSFIFAFLFTTLVCVSRLTEGAHFITDVVAGVVVTLTTRLVLKRLLFRKLLTSS